jgi:hypothetical protein
MADRSSTGGSSSISNSLFSFFHASALHGVAYLPDHINVDLNSSQGILILSQQLGKPCGAPYLGQVMRCRNLFSRRVGPRTLWLRAITAFMTSSNATALSRRNASHTASALPAAAPVPSPLGHHTNRPVDSHVCVSQNPLPSLLCGSTCHAGCGTQTDIPRTGRTGVSPDISAPVNRCPSFHRQLRLLPGCASAV